MGGLIDRKVVTEGTEGVQTYFFKEELDINVEDICKTWIVNHKKDQINNFFFLR